MNVNYENKPHRHDFYELTWLTSTCDQILVDFNLYKTKKDAIFFLNPGMINQYNTTGKTGTLIVFSKDFVSENTNLLHSLFMNFYDLPFVQPDKKELTQLQLILKLMKAEFFQSNPDLIILRSYLISFLLNMQKMQHETSFVKSNNRERIIHFYHLIEANFKKEHKAEFYASSLNLTTQQTNRILKEQFGKTISYLLHERIVLEAKRQILLSNKSIKEIGYLLGFEDPAYFSRFIKRHTGIPPEVLKTEMFIKYK